jgi:hypothetical protein
MWQKKRAHGSRGHLPRGLRKLTRLVRTVRLDTGELVRERTMTAEERQQNLITE